MLHFGCLLPSRCLICSLVPQHKKLAEGSAYEELPTSVMYSENDISNSIKNGILYLEDPINHVRFCHCHPGPRSVGSINEVVTLQEGRAAAQTVRGAVDLSCFSGVSGG